MSVICVQWSWCVAGDRRIGKLREKTAMIEFDRISEGDSLSEVVKGPVDRVQLALFAGASGDHNPIHLDDEQAAAAGLPGVIVHGMLNMAFLGQLLSQWAGPARVRNFSNRFGAMAFPGDIITCRGLVTGKREEGSERLIDLEIEAINQNGETLLSGKASVAAN